ncbi:hypothetical protein ACFL96_01110 [Thermoproteota archaeon]
MDDQDRFEPNSSEFEALPLFQTSKEAAFLQIKPIDSEKAIEKQAFQKTSRKASQKNNWTFVENWANRDILPGKHKNQDELIEFLKMKKSPGLSDREKILKRFNEEKVGKDIWIIGLISLLYDKSVSSASFQESLVQKLTLHLNENDLFLLLSTLEAFQTQQQSFSQTAKENIMAELLKNDLIKHPNEQIRTAAIDLFKSISPPLAMNVTLEQTESEHDVSKPELPKKASVIIPKPRPLFPPRILKHPGSPKATLATALLIAAIFHNLNPNSAYQLAWISLHIDEFIDQIYERLETLDALKIAFVTHPSASISDHQKFPGFEVVEFDPLHYIGAFFYRFQKLFDEGYHCIYALLPDATTWPAYHYAKHASYKMEDWIHVIDTGTFGIGLALILQDLSNYLLNIRELDTQNIEAQLASSISRLRYWMIIDSAEYLKKHFWFQQLCKKSDIEINKHNSPVLCLNQPISIVDHQSDFSSGISHIESNVKRYISSQVSQPKEIVIEQSGHPREAKHLQQRLKAAFPELSVISMPPSQALNGEFGNHLGLCLL